MKLFKKKYMFFIVFLPQQIFSACFNYSPGTSFWPMLNSVGNISKSIVGCVTSISAADIAAGGYTISAPGNYRLVEDAVATSGPAITITASNVHLDLNNFLITGNFGGMFPSIIRISGNNVAIANGRLTGGAAQPAYGILMDTGASNISLSHLIVSNINFIPVYMFDQNTNISLDSVTVFGNSLASAAGIEAAGVKNLLLSDCKVFSALGTGIFITGGSISGSDTVHILNCLSEGCAQNGLALNSTTNAYIGDYFSNNDALNGIRILFNSEFIEIERAQILNSGVSGILIDNDIKNVSISGCLIQNSDLNGIWLTSQNLNILIQDCDLLFSGSCGLLAQDCGNVTVSGCASKSNAVHGFAFLPTFTNADIGPYNVALDVDSCKASDNLQEGFYIPSYQDPNNLLDTNFAWSLFKNNVAVGNGFSSRDGSAVAQGNGFSLALKNSEIIQNLAINNAKNNMIFFNSGTNSIIENRCMQPQVLSGAPIYANFSGTMANGSSNNIWLGNYAAAYNTSTNYDVSDTILQVTLSPSVPLTAVNSAYWVNVDAQFP